MSACTSRPVLKIVDCSIPMISDLNIRSKYGTNMSWGGIYVERSPFRGQHQGKIRVKAGNLIKLI
jgi:hypothetical protein